jgi:acetate CoA/acetoacetate CoA-transferase beta subunit
MGGAMDLVSGAKRVIVTLSHRQNGESKILKKCVLPLTAKGRVNTIITEMAFIQVTDKGLVLKEIGPDVTIEQVVAATDARLIVPADVGRFG